MARGGITEIDFQKAVAKLLSEDVELSVRSIRAAIGEGSMTTVSRMLQAYRKRHPVAHEGGSASPIEIAVSVMHDKLVEQVERDLEQRVVKLDTAATQAAGSLARAKEMIAALSKANRELEEENQKITVENQALSSDLDAAKVRISEQSGQLLRMGAELSEALLREGHQKDKISEQESLIKHLRSTEQSQLRTIEILQSKSDELGHAASSLRDKITTLEQRLDNDNRTLNEELNRATTKIHNLDKELTLLNKSNEHLATENDAQSKIIEALQKKNEELAQLSIIDQQSSMHNLSEKMDLILNSIPKDSEFNSTVSIDKKKRPSKK